MTLFAVLEGSAQDAVPQSAGTLFPNIRASIDDGFYSLAEQQARGVLRGDPSPKEEHDAVLLLAHALWGQKRYSAMLELLEPYDGDPGYVYWRARACYEVRDYERALKVLSVQDETSHASIFPPFILRLRAHVEKVSGRLEAAEASCLLFEQRYSGHPEQIGNQFDLADIYVRAGRIPEAIGVYESLLADHGSLAAQQAQLRLAHVIHTQGAEENFDRARSLLNQLGTNEQNRLSYRIDAFVELGVLEQMAERTPDAADAMRRAIALSPDAQQRVPLKLTLARIYLQDDQIDAALRLLEECRVEAPSTDVAAELQLAKAGALFQAGQHEDAVKAYQVYLDVADDPEGTAQAYWGKGIGLWELERYAEAATVLDKAVDLLRDPAKRTEALFKAGDAYYRSGNIEAAAERYSDFVGLFPGNELMPNALYQLGLSQVKIGKLAEALVTFETIESNYEASPFAEKAALRYADTLFASQQLEKALAQYEKIGKTYEGTPSAGIALHQSGLILYQLSRFAEAQTVFERVVAEFSGNEFAPQAFYMRGFCQYLLGDIEAAVETCSRFVRDFPDSQWTPDVVFWLAEQNFNAGKYEEAGPLFLRIVTEFKSHALAPRALYWAGRCAAAQSNYVKALELFADIAKNYPEDAILPQTRFSQGDVLAELGEFARAILAFDEIIRKYPDNYLVNAALGRKGDCQFTLAASDPARYAEALSSYQAIMDRPSAPLALKLQAEYKIGRCHEKTGMPAKAFNRYMNVVYTFMNENVERSPYAVMWFTRSAFGAAALKEIDQAWVEAARIYERVVEANVPAGDEAVKRLERLKKDNWLLFQRTEETDHVGIDG
ncbi:MAG TPA: tetratricopeptide repeat protein [Pontiella sp.]